jgi:ribosomal protein S18 acetylase RimI-like enzyme
MLIRKATAGEMLALWGCENADNASPTARFFHRNISAGNAVFWALEDDGGIIGELYAFLDLEDKDFADGKNSAYLCAFRVKKERRGRGLGTSLMEKALAELKESGFRRATVGVEPGEKANLRLYGRLGFKEKVKECHYDPCGFDGDMKPVYEEEGWWLLAKEL